MNILLIIILVLFLLSLYSGYKNGFLKTVFSLVSWIIVLVVCNAATPIVTDALIEKTDIAVTIQATIEEKLNEIINQTMESSGIADLEAALPAELKDALSGENGNAEDFVTGENVINTTSLVYSIMSILGFLIVVVIVRVAMIVIDMVLGIASKLPIIGPVDKLLGLVCGVGKGLIWSWVVLAFVSILTLTGTDVTFASYISESQILTWLQDNNVLLNIILK